MVNGVYPWRSTLKTTKKTNRSYSGITLAFCLFIAVLLMYCTLFFPDRIGAADNGDFSRLANRIGIDGGLNWLSDNPNAFFVTLREEWPWLSMDWNMFMPRGIAFSNGILATIIRGLTNAVSDTATTSFSTVYLEIGYLVLLAIAWYWIFKFFQKRLGRAFPIFFLLAIIVLFGSMHLAWLNSFYGEAMMYVGLLLCIGCVLETISVPKGSIRGLVLSLLSSACVYLLVLSKPQSTLGFLIWGWMPLCLIKYHICGCFSWKSMIRKAMAVICACLVTINLVWTGVCCIEFYKWNSETVEDDTLYHAVMLGILTLTDNPEEMCEELGIDRVLAQDVGKHAYLEKEQYVTAPRTPEADERLYSRINTFGLLKYYIQHPTYLLNALEITARNAIRPATSLHVFKNEVGGYKGRWTLWASIREYCVPHHFWQYVIVYSVLFVSCGYLFFHNERKEIRLLILLLICIMLTGILQYPLAFIGNGYADTNKQLYLFMLSYDVTILGAIMFVIKKVQVHLKRID